MSQTDIVDRYAWWAHLKHGGLLIAPSKLQEFFPEDIAALPRHLSDRLRTAVLRLEDDPTSQLSELLDTLLQDVLELPAVQWTKASDVDSSWSRKLMTGENVKPRRVWSDSKGGVLPVFTDAEARLGVGRGRRSVARVLEWLRKADQKIALLTNGRQWRLIHAGSDYDAWCEWDTDLWFEEGVPGPQVSALRILLGKDALEVRDGARPALVEAILASRKGQAELSAVLGERVRQAVEILVRESSGALKPLLNGSGSSATNRDIYIAACRIIMRCVVILFAEARHLLPRENQIYEDSYSLQGLRGQLDRIASARGAERLRHSHSAWPRLMSLFRLVYGGSPHEAIPILSYGGGLFAPGNWASPKGLERALAALEDPGNAPDDYAIHRILELLCRSQVKVRQGRSSTWVSAPVDFSDLSSEYIGILYEGLLDYELRQAGDEPMLFLNLGNQPVLPFSRVDTMSNKDLAELLSKLKQNKKDEAAEEGSEEEETEEAETETEPEEETAEEQQAPEPTEVTEEELAAPEDDNRRVVSEMVQIWAERAVKAAKLVPYPKDDSDPLIREAFNRQVTDAGKKLVSRIVMPEEWFLVRWGGTRKGSGTFYTRPQLAGPTVRRTLEPLVYRQQDGEAASEATATRIPRRPEEILALKVCDPAMGSGSFLVSALRYLVQALQESLHHYGRLDASAERTICRLADGLPVDSPSQETLPVPPDHPEFEERLRARLKRHVVERCIYGVDLDPLAVELARMALWIETMDPRLPFGFLDHKLKCGNSLVGCWFDRFQDYPVMAWQREGGDKNHTRFVHHFREYEGTGKKKGQQLKSGDKWTAAIKELRDGRVKNELRDSITGQKTFAFLRAGQTPEGIHDRAMEALEQLHRLPVHESQKREEAYAGLQADGDFQRLKEAFDTWCAIWFWPGDELDCAPVPSDFLKPPDATGAIVARLQDEHRFFHWELEFPDVFAKADAGFDAMLGNPPWEIQKPNSKEFFSNLDPLYRTYGKQEAIGKQVVCFTAESGVEASWLDYCARLKGLSNWTSSAWAPYGDPAEADDAFSFSRSGGENQSLHEAWRNRRRNRRGYADTAHPFRHQGSADINTYKMFLEQAHSLLHRAGRLGIIVPSGVYTDKGSTGLRELFLSRCSWEWLFGFENREGIFDIHRSFKFCPIIVRKGGKTESIKAAFMHRSLEDWEEAEKHVLAYPGSRVSHFSPKSKAVLEIRSEKDLEVLNKLYSNGVLLGDDGPNGWGIHYATEFHMTNDSALFPPRPKWEADGYRPDEYGHWLKGGWRSWDGGKSILKRPRGLVLSRDGTEVIDLKDIEDVALPLYEGRMIGQFDFSEKGWVRGRGRGAVWREILWEAKVVEPQFCMGLRTYLDHIPDEGREAALSTTVGFMDVSSATNTRTMISAVIHGAPCGNKVPLFLMPGGAMAERFALSAVLNSLTYDFQLRCRLGGTTLNYFIVEESCVVGLNQIRACPQFSLNAMRLSAVGFPYSDCWIQLTQSVGSRNVRSLWAATPYERLRVRCVSDAVAASLFGIGIADFSQILMDCDLPCTALSGDATRRLDPKGFWRVDKDQDPELRHTDLALLAFRDLEQRGLTEFLQQNDGEGWMIPEKLRLADYGLGRDERAKEYQPVASRLGPRFYDWQFSQSVEESWEECERHAELIHHIVPFPEQPVQSDRPNDPKPPTDLFGNRVPVDLFGNRLYPKGKRG